MTRVILLQGLTPMENNYISLSDLKDRIARQEKMSKSAQGSTHLTLHRPTSGSGYVTIHHSDGRHALIGKYHQGEPGIKPTSRILGSKHLYDVMQHHGVTAGNISSLAVGTSHKSASRPHDPSSATTAVEWTRRPGG